jgi:transcriptional regulator with XRE-family HTH domain
VDTTRGRLPGRGRRGCRTDTPVRARPHQEYARWRTRQIAYGTWEPWADAAAVRGHVRRLRAARVSYQAIASAAGVSAMTVHRLEHGQGHASGRQCAEQRSTKRIRVAVAQRLLAVSPAIVEQQAVRQDASGARRRLQALIAVGHPPASLAHHLGAKPRWVSRIVRGTTATVTPRMHAAICDLYDQIWDKRPPEHTAAQRQAAAAARALAAGSGWPTPMGLDDDLMDDPAYRPRTQWRPAAGHDAQCHHEGRLSTDAPSGRKLSTAVGRRSPAGRPGCQAASAQHRSGGH